jgi:putative addiction module CopG family antidote
MPSKRAISVSLTEHLNEFVRTEIAAGRYRTASEVIRAALRLLEAQALHRSLNGSAQPDAPDDAKEPRGRRPTSVGKEGP